MTDLSILMAAADRVAKWYDLHGIVAFWRAETCGLTIYATQGPHSQTQSIAWATIESARHPDRILERLEEMALSRLPKRPLPPVQSTVDELAKHVTSFQMVMKPENELTPCSLLESDHPWQAKPLFEAEFTIKCQRPVPDCIRNFVEAFQRQQDKGTKA